MHDEHLSTAIKDAGESFAPPVPDVHGIVRRGRGRLWTARLAVAASILLVAGGTVALVRSGASGEGAVVRPAAAPSLQWTAIADAPLKPRSGPASVWTGTELIVWGGHPDDDEDGNDKFLDGAAYDPALDEWTKLPRSPLRGGGQTAVWTGSEVILWGGEYGDGSHEAPDTGAAYNPRTGKWRQLPSSLPYWSLGGHTAVWTGTEMIVWGGVESGSESGGIYNPETDEWRVIPEGLLDTRHGHDAVWTGDRMVVWGGKSQGGLPTTGGEGAAFDPATGEWTPIAESPLGTLISPVSVWTGEEMIVTGGLAHPVASRAGAAYDPLADRWRKIRDLPRAPERDGQPVALYDTGSAPSWTGDEALFVTADGVLAYDPEGNRWQFVDAPAEAKVTDAVTAWTGDSLIVWGGRTWESPDQTSGGWIGRE